MKKLIAAISIAALLWFIMFSPWTSGLVSFWSAMTASALILTCMSFYLYPTLKTEFHLTSMAVVIGLLSALLLWLVFYLGDYFSTLLFDFAKPQVGGIYHMKVGYNPWVIGALLLFIIGPAEEIFWRGYVQNNLSRKYGSWVGVAATTLIYALVHLWSFNFMLIMAAMVCGAFWGLLYMQQKNNLVALIISHAVWDVAVFLIFPIL